MQLSNTQVSVSDVSIARVLHATFGNEQIAFREPTKVNGMVFNRTDRRNILTSQLQEWIATQKKCAIIFNDKMFKDDRALYQAIKNIIQREALPYHIWFVDKLIMYIWRDDAPLSYWPQGYIQTIKD